MAGNVAVAYVIALCFVLATMLRVVGPRRDRRFDACLLCGKRDGKHHPTCPWARD